MFIKKILIVTFCDEEAESLRVHNLGHRPKGNNIFFSGWKPVTLAEERIGVSDLQSGKTYLLKLGTMPQVMDSQAFSLFTAKRYNQKNQILKS